MTGADFGGVPISWLALLIARVEGLLCGGGGIGERVSFNRQLLVLEFQIGDLKLIILALIFAHVRRTSPNSEGRANNQASHRLTRTFDTLNLE